MNAFGYELFVNFRLSFHLCVKSAGVLTIKIFRKMFDFKRIIHQTKPIRDPRNVTWFKFFSEVHDIPRADWKSHRLFY